MIKGIRHIIFDLGGVLLNIDYKLTEQAFIDLGIADFGTRFSQLSQNGLFDRLEMGQISEDTFFDEMRLAAGAPLSNEQIRTAWNAMILEYPLRRLQLLQQLRLYYDLFLLSNTNSIHEQKFNDVLSRNHGMPSLAVFFDKVYFSHRVGLRKPMPEIFELILNSNGLKPEHTLFIDDSPQHIAAAQKLGIQTIFLEQGMTIENDIFKAKNQA